MQKTGTGLIKNIHESPIPPRRPSPVDYALFLPSCAAVLARDELDAVTLPAQLALQDGVQRRIRLLEMLVHLENPLERCETLPGFKVCRSQFKRNA